MYSTKLQKLLKQGHHQLAKVPISQIQTPENDDETVHENLTELLNIVNFDN